MATPEMLRGAIATYTVQQKAKRNKTLDALLFPLMEEAAVTDDRYKRLALLETLHVRSPAFTAHLASLIDQVRLTLLKHMVAQQEVAQRARWLGYTFAPLAATNATIIDAVCALLTLSVHLNPHDHELLAQYAYVASLEPKEEDLEELLALLRSVLTTPEQPASIAVRVTQWRNPFSAAREAMCLPAKTSAPAFKVAPSTSSPSRVTAAPSKTAPVKTLSKTPVKPAPPTAVKAAPKNAIQPNTSDKPAPKSTTLSSAADKSKPAVKKEGAIHAPKLVAPAKTTVAAKSASTGVSDTKNEPVVEPKRVDVIAVTALSKGRCALQLGQLLIRLYRGGTHKIDQASVQAAFETAIETMPTVHDPYLHLATFYLDESVGAGAEQKVALQTLALSSLLRFIVQPLPPLEKSAHSDADDLHLVTERNRLMMKKELLPHYMGDQRLVDGLIAEGRSQGIQSLRKYIDQLDDLGQSKLCMAVYAGVNGKTVEDPELNDFFKAKCWK